MELCGMRKNQRCITGGQVWNQKYVYLCWALATQEVFYFLLYLNLRSHRILKERFLASFTCVIGVESRPGKLCTSMKAFIFNPVLQLMKVELQYLWQTIVSGAFLILVKSIQDRAVSLQKPNAERITN